MSKVISKEEAKEWINEASEFVDKYHLRELYMDALEDSNTMFVMSSSLTIIYKEAGIADDVIGYYIHPIYDTINVWFAKEDSRGIVDGRGLLECKSDISYQDLISKCRIETNKCPICGKSVPYSEQKSYSFAGRCCKDCLPKMQKEHEYPGWYN